jgi:hypothetical protein
MNLNRRETATVLAALRLFQQRQVNCDMERVFPEFFNDEGQVPLAQYEIDDLCERINFAEPCLPLTAPTAKVLAEDLDYNLRHNSRDLPYSFKHPSGLREIREDILHKLERLQGEIRSIVQSAKG